MLWADTPESVLLLRKYSDRQVVGPFCQMTSWLVQEMGLNVYVESCDLCDGVLDQDGGYRAVKDGLIPFVECEDAEDLIDLVICLGGDSTLLHASSLFQGRVPPVMAFNVGSRGFLTPFQYGPDFRQCVSDVMEGSPNIFLRYRLDCTLNNGASTTTIKTGIHGARCTKSRHVVLNEVVLNRGPSSTLSNFEIYIGDRLVTSVQGDGLIMSSPTGSTAYSVSAGASMVHPGVPCVLITPICPHSLSFRPIIVPAGVKVKVKLCGECPDVTCMVCFDGRDRHELQHGDELEISTSKHSLPSICSSNHMEDWFDSLASCLHWNIRLSQKPMGTSGTRSNSNTASPTKSPFSSSSSSTALSSSRAYSSPSSSSSSSSSSTSSSLASSLSSSSSSASSSRTSSLSLSSTSSPELSISLSSSLSSSSSSSSSSPTSSPPTTTTTLQISLKPIDSNSNRDHSAISVIESGCKEQLGDKDAIHSFSCKQILRETGENVGDGVRTAITGKLFQETPSENSKLPDLCQVGLSSKSVETDLNDLRVSEESLQMRHDNSFNNNTSRSEAKTFRKSRDRNSSPKYHIVSGSSSVILRRNVNDVERFHNALNSGPTKVRVRPEQLKVKDTNFNEVSFLSSKRTTSFTRNPANWNESNRRSLPEVTLGIGEDSTANHFVVTPDVGISDQGLVL